MLSCRHPYGIALLAVLVAAAFPGAAQAITRGAAESRALTELGVRTGQDPVIVFGARRPIAAGAVVTEAGDRIAHSGDRAGLRTIAAPVVIRNGDEPSYLFHEDRGPYQTFEHPGRVVLVGQRSGRVRVSRATTWIPVVDGTVVPWFATAGSYERTAYRVFERGAGAVGAAVRRSARASARAAAADAAGLDARRRVGNALAAERSCALRVSDTLGNFFDFSGVDRSRARLGMLLEQLERLNGGFRSQRYLAASGRTPTAELQRMISRRGCRDVLLYLAGSGYRGGAPAVNVGTASRAGAVRLQDVSAGAIERLLQANRGVTFKVVVDAPYGGRLTEVLGDEANLAMLLTAGGAGEPSYAYLPNVVAGGTLVRNTLNPDQLLEFTNRLVRGMTAFVDSPLEVDHALGEIAAGRARSMMVWMLARGLALGQAGAPALPVAPVLTLGGTVRPPNAPPPVSVPTVTPVPGPVAAPNAAPVAADATLAVVEDTPTAAPLGATDADGDRLTFSIVEAPAHGTLTGTGGARVYTPDVDRSGPDAFVFAVEDGRGGRDTARVTVNVGAVDDDAEIVTASGLATFTEKGAPATIDDAVRITDVDTATLSSATVAITGGFAGAEDVLSFAGTAAIAGAYDAATGVLTLTGTAPVADYQAALRTVRYRNTSDAPTGASRAVTFAAAGGSALRGLALTEVNDPPVLTLPGAQSADEDTPLVFAPGNANAVSVADADARTRPIEVALGVDHGTLSLAGDLASLEFTTGDGTGDAAMEFAGRASAVNAALAGLGYLGDRDFHGADALTVRVDDLGNTGTGPAGVDAGTVAIAVGARNDAPVVTVPAPTATLAEESSTVLAGADAPSIADVDGGGADLAVTLEVAHGVLDLASTAGLDFTTGNGDDDPRLVFTGAPAAVNAALDGLRYAPDTDFAGADTLTISAGDGGNTGGGGTQTGTGTVAFTVTGVNDAPVVTVPGAQTLAEDTSRAIAPSVADVDAGGEDLEVTLDVAEGTLDLATAAGLDFDEGDGADDPRVVATGSAAAVNAALDGLTYTPDRDFSGADTLTVAVSDLGHSGAGVPRTDSGTVAFTVSAVNDAPVVTVPGAQTLVEDATRTLSPTVADVDAGGEDLRVTLRVLEGTLTLGDPGAVDFTGAGAAGDGTSDAEMTFAGTVAEVNAALAGLIYAPAANFSGADTLTLTVGDQGHTGAEGAKSDTETVAFTVTAENDAPVVTVPGAQTLAEDTSRAIAPSVADVDAGGEDLELTLDVADGTLDLATAAGLDFDEGDGADDARVVATGSAAAVNAALDGLTYTPDQDFSGADTLTVAVSDLGHSGAGVPRTDSETVAFTVSAVNDPPVTRLPGPQTVVEDGTLALSGTSALSVSDVDAGGADLSVALSVGDGTLTADTPAGGTRGGEGTGALTLTGTVAALNTALGSLVYTPAPDFAGGETLHVVTGDGGATGSGGARTDTGDLAITVTAVPDDPRFTSDATPVALDYDEGDGATEVFPTIEPVDPDAGDLASATVQLTAGYVEDEDVLSLADQPGITDTFDPATGTLTLTGPASVTAFRTALRAVRYANTSDTPSTATRTATFTIVDPTGRTATTARDVTVAAVNDRPVVGLSGATPEFTEEGAPVVVDGGLTVTDADDTEIESARVEVTDNVITSSDTLTFTPAHGITDQDTAAHVLSLAGTATTAQWAAVLRTVRFANSETKEPGDARTVAFTVNDGDDDSAPAEKTVAIVDTPDGPVVTTSNGSTAYTEDVSAPVAVDAGLTVAAGSDPQIDSGRVAITGGLQSGDTLTFASDGTFTGAYAAGVLTITTPSGEATAAQWQTALRSIAFSTTSNSPAATKTVTFTLDDGTDEGAPAAKAIAVTETNDAPQLTAGGTLAFTENDPATEIDADQTVAEPEGEQLTSATALVTAGFQPGEDQITWTDGDPGDAITRDLLYTPPIGQGGIRLVGTASAAAYEAALEDVLYANDSDNPSAAARTVTFSATDARSGTGTATRAISVAPVDDPPSAVADAATVLEDAPATAVTVLANDTDVDGGPKTIASATDPANGTVALTGGTAGAHTGLTYRPDPDFCNAPPGTTLDTFTYALNGGSSATVTMTVTCVNDAPVADDESLAGNDSAHGNTTMQVDAPGDDRPAPSEPHTEVTGDVLAGDTDVENDTLAVKAETIATRRTDTNALDGGSVTIEADGDFVLRPSATQSCTQGSTYFDYTVQDSGSPSASDTGRVTVAIAGCVWYVDNDPATAGNSGTSAAPFDTLAQAEAASQANHTVFVFDDDNASSGLDGGGTTSYVMNAGERLIGEHEGLTVDQDHGTAGTSYTPDVLRGAAGGAYPTLTASSADVIELAAGNELRGLQLDPQGAGSGGVAGGAGDTNGTFDDLRIIDAGTAGDDPAFELSGMASGTSTITNLTVDTTPATTAPPSTAVGVRLVGAGTVDVGGATTVKTKNAAGLVASNVNLSTSSFDAIEVANSASGGVSLANATGTTSLQLGDGVGTDLSLQTVSGAPGAFVASNVPGLVVGAAGTDTVTASGTAAVDVAYGTAPGSAAAPALDFDTITSTGAVNAISLDNLGPGTFSAGSGSSIAGASGTAFDLDRGSGAVSYAGSIANGEGRAIEVTRRETGSTTTFSGSIVDTGDADANAEDGGIVLNANTGGSTTISNATKTLNTGEDHALVFTASDGHTLHVQGGGLDVDTTTGKGIDASASGTLSVTGTGNTIDTGAGKALSVVTTDVGTTPLTFQRIASNGANGGIVLDRTGTNAALTVTGSGGTCDHTTQAGCSGGVIQGTTGGDSSAAIPGGAGIALSDTRGVSLTRVNVRDHSNYGIRGTDVVGFSLTDSVVNGTNGTNDGGSFQDSSVLFDNLTGTGAGLTGSATVTRTFLTGGYANQFRVSNDSGTLNRLTFDAVRAGSTTNRNDTLAVEGIGSATTNVTVRNSTFTGTAGDHVQFIGDGSGGGDLDYEANTHTNNHPLIATGGGYISLMGGAAGAVTMNVHGANTFRDGLTSAILMVKSFGTGSLRSTITGAQIGVAGVANSGSLEGSGIEFKHAGGPTSSNATVTIANNTIRQYNNFGINLQAGAGIASPGTFNATVTGNTIAEPGTNAAIGSPFQGIQLNNGTTPAGVNGDTVNGDSFQTCAHIQGNSAPNSGRNGGHDLRVRQRMNTTIRLPGYSGGNTDTTAVANFLGAQNTVVTRSAAAESSNVPSGGGFVGGASCPQ